MRNRKATEEKLIAAVESLLARDGFRAIGVNAVAKEAGVDKKLIYRYFGGLAPLLDAYASSRRFWPSTSDLLPEDEGRIDELATRILKRHLRALRDRPLTQEIMRWELLERSDFTDRLAEAREQAGLELVARMAAASDEELLSGRRAEQFASVAALLHAGISYLVLRSKTADRYIGIDLSTPDGWRSVESAIEILVRSYFTHTHSEKGDEDE